MRKEWYEEMGISKVKSSAALGRDGEKDSKLPLLEYCAQLLLVFPSCVPLITGNALSIMKLYSLQKFLRWYRKYFSLYTRI